MRIVTNIIEALRRVGSATQKTALQRQDEQLTGKQILERRREIVRGPDGQAETFVATIAPIPETVFVLSREELQPILENASLVQGFLSAFAQSNHSEWTLEELDLAFRNWICGSNKNDFPDDAVTEILGAAYGQYCVAHLHMRWIRLTDQDGSTLAIEGVEREFRAFPYQAVTKRIADSEYGFFKVIFTILRSYSEEARVRSNVA